MFVSGQRVTIGELVSLLSRMDQGSPVVLSHWSVTVRNNIDSLFDGFNTTARSAGADIQLRMEFVGSLNIEGLYPEQQQLPSVRRIEDCKRLPGSPAVRGEQDQ